MMISTLNSQAFCSAAMQLFQSPPDNRGGPSFEEVVSRHDADGDGKLSIDEVSISEEAFAKADANGDGVIDQTEFDDGGNKIIGDDLRSQDEFPPMGPPPERASEPSFGEVVSRHDADGDGTLSIDELGCTEEAFAEADANGDGVIDQTEFDDGGTRSLEMTCGLRGHLAFHLNPVLVISKMLSR